MKTNTRLYSIIITLSFLFISSFTFAGNNLHAVDIQITSQNYLNGHPSKVLRPSSNRNLLLNPLSSVQLMDSIHGWNWDNNLQQWQIGPNYRLINFVYDTNNNLLERLSQSFIGGTWVNAFKDVMTYNSTNDNLTFLRLNWNSTSWVNSQYIIYTYNNSHMITSYEIQNWNGASWVSLTKEQTSYNSNNDTLTRLKQTWNGASWDNEEMRIYTYDANFNNLSYIEQSWINNVWENDFKYVNTYDASNKLISKVQQIWGISNWFDDFQFLYTYQNNNLTMVLVQFWNLTWEDIERSSFTYDVNNNRLTELDEEMNGTTWQNQSLYNYSYDAQFNQTGEEMFNWGNGVWENYYRIIRSFNSNNILLSYIAQSWNNGNSQYQPSQERIYGVDPDNFIYSFKYKYYDINTGLVSFADSIIYYYNTITTGIVDTKQKESIAVYPNPASSIINVVAGNIIDSEIIIYDLNGRKIYDKEFSLIYPNEKINIEIQAFTPGLYFLQVISEKEITYGKFIVQRE